MSPLSWLGIAGGGMLSGMPLTSIFGGLGLGNSFHPGYDSTADAAKAMFMPQAYAAEQNAKMTMETNRQNRLNIEYQNAQNIAQWERENAYNNPINQMQRMRAAGLNPAMLYGGSGAVATSAPSPMLQGARDVAPNMAGYDSPLDAILKIAQARNIEANTEKQRSDTDVNQSIVRVNDNSIEVGKVRLELDTKSTEANVNHLSRLAQDIERRWTLLDEEIELTRSKIKGEDERVTAQRLENYFNSSVMSARIDMAFEQLEQSQIQNKISKEQFKELCELFVINKQIAGEQLNQLISQGRFDERLRPYQLLEQQNDAWISGQELQTARFNLQLSKDKHGRHTEVGRYVDDVFGCIGQVFGGTASHSVTTNKSRAAKPIVTKLK